MPKLNYFELKENVAGLGETLNKIDAEIEESASSADYSQEAIDKLNALKEKKEALTAKFDTLKEALDKQKKSMQFKKEEKAKADTPEQARTNAFAEMVRATMGNKPVNPEALQQLGENPTLDNDTTGGNKFLPKTVSTSIISDPTETNPLRQLSTVTQIPNLEIPRISFTVDDDGFIADGDAAKEIAAKGDTVQFTRNKFKVRVGMSETVLLGSNAELTAYVEQGLKNGVVVKERSVAFNPNPTKPEEKHMSFYDDSNAIKKVSGSDLYEAITNAVADLHETYREKATIVMSYKDYLSIVKTLANGSAALYSAQPEQILGKPVVFTDAAVKPIVGDFSYSQYNYDISALYDQEKDIKTGIYQFVVTAWMDHRIKLASAFRIADVTSGTTSK